MDVFQNYTPTQGEKLTLTESTVTKLLRPDPKCPSQDELFLVLHVTLRYSCRQLSWAHLCPAYQTYTQHPLLPHLVYLSERTVVYKTKSTDLKYCVLKITSIYRPQPTSYSLTTLYLQTIAICENRSTLV